MTTSPLRPDPRLDLVLERVVDVPKALVWRAWTEPALITQWFTPAPWTTPECEIDLRPGGAFRTVMRSPEGQSFDNVGCFLEVIHEERLVWTPVLAPGFRPAAGGEMPFTGVIMLEDHGSGTKYTAIAMHPDEDTRVKHEQMGFHEGWGKALDQLVALVKTL